MIPVDEFFQLPRDKQEQLVSRNQVIVDGDMSDTIPDPSESIYVLDSPPKAKIKELLKQGRYTLAELQDELPLSKQPIRDVLDSLRHNQQEVLSKDRAVFRVADTQGVAYVYSLEAIPFHARIADPLLFRTLDIGPSQLPTELLVSFDNVPESELNTYIERTSEYWEFEKETIRHELSELSPSFGYTKFGAVPLPTTLPKLDRDRSRFINPDVVYKRRRVNNRSIEIGTALRSSRVRQTPTLPVVQEFALYGFDMRHHHRTSDNISSEIITNLETSFVKSLDLSETPPDRVTRWQPPDLNLPINEFSERDKRIADLVRLQPTKNSELEKKWGLDSGSQVHQYLTQELEEYFFRDESAFICATELAEEHIINRWLEIESNEEQVPDLPLYGR